MTDPERPVWPPKDIDPEFLEEVHQDCHDLEDFDDSFDEDIEAEQGDEYELDAEDELVVDADLDDEDPADDDIDLEEDPC